MIEGEAETVQSVIIEQDDPDGYRPVQRQDNRTRRLVIYLLGGIMTVVACLMVGAAMLRGSWWYPMMTDRVLTDEQRAQLRVIRDEVEQSGTAPDAVRWLDEALTPGTGTTDVYGALIEALTVLKSSSNTETSWVSGIQDAIDWIRPHSSANDGTAYPISTLSLELR